MCARLPSAAIAARAIGSLKVVYSRPVSSRMTKRVLPDFVWYAFTSSTLTVASGTALFYPRPRPPTRLLPQAAQRDPCGDVAAQPVDAAAGRRRGRAQIHPVERRPVRHEAPGRTEEQLAQVHRAVVEVAADEAAVVRLERRRPHRVTGEHDVSEPGREAFDLRLDPLGHVDRRAVRQVAVGPRGLAARRVEP